MVDGCYEADVCVPRGKTTDNSAYCDGNCPITCRDSEILCDGQIIYGGEKEGCKAEDTCHQKARDVNGQYCPDNSDSHECPITCPQDTHQFGAIQSQPVAIYQENCFHHAWGIH